WMLNMQFPLDMIWFDQDGKVVHIEENVPPCKTALEITTCQSVVPDEEATYILEVTSGFVVQNNITKDSILTIISI
ncbi:putative ACR protein, partial [Marine Group I thaumarchaeote SCGC AAA799-P11]